MSGPLSCRGQKRNGAEDGAPAVANFEHFFAGEFAACCLVCNGPPSIVRRYDLRGIKVVRNDTSVSFDDSVSSYEIE